MPRSKSLQNSWEKSKKSNRLVTSELQKNKKCHILSIFPVLGKLTQWAFTFSLCSCMFLMLNCLSEKCRAASIDGRGKSGETSWKEEFLETKLRFICRTLETSTKFAFDCSWYETKTNTNWCLKVKRQNFHSILTKYYEKLRLPVILMTSTRVKKGCNGSFLKAGAYQNRCAMYK